jgi:hypothetical protein
MSRPPHRPISPVYLGGPLHGQFVERVYRDSGGRIQVSDRAGLRDVMSTEFSFTYVTYVPQRFAWTGGLGETIEIMIWVDERLCEIARDRLMKEIMVEFRWADQLNLNGP